jgi:hypothetical protein
MEKERDNTTKHPPHKKKNLYLPTHQILRYNQKRRNQGRTLSP